jgi:hypothetical protein
MSAGVSGNTLGIAIVDHLIVNWLRAVNLGLKKDV